MKVFIVVWMTWIMSFAPAAYAGEIDGCTAKAIVIEAIARARDKNISKRAAFLLVEPEGNWAKMAVIYVYGLPHMSGEELADNFFNECVSEDN